MFKKLMIAGGLATLPLVFALLAQSDLKSTVDKSMKAMGVDSVKTLTISGEGGDGSVGQPFSPFSDRWRWTASKNWTRSVDFDAKGWKDVRDRSEGEPEGKCGGAGTQCPANSTTGQTAIGMANNFNNQINFAMMPLGFLKLALEKNATVSKEKKDTVLSFPMDAGAGAATYKTNAKGYINDQGYVTRVETKIDQGMLGDIVWSADFTNYKDFGGVKFPTSIVQRQGGPQIWAMNVSDVKANQPVDLTAPAGRGGGKGGGAPGGAPGGGKGGGAPGGAPGGPGAAKGGPGGGAPGGGAPGGGRGGAAAAAIEDEDLGGGFWLVTTGYGAVVANFKDYVVVIEGPQNDATSDQILAEAKKLVPNKPIKYVINTHAHFDHAGGLRDFVNAGATIITNQGNKGYYEKILANPHTLVPDNMQKAGNKAKVKVEYVGDKKVMTDGAGHTIEMYLVKGSTHNQFMMMVYLPAQKILIEADEFNVLGNPAPTTPAAMPNQYQVNLLKDIEDLKLNVDRIIPIHLPTPRTRKVTLAELKLAAGKNP
jgi:glyoxylase-like metal-dependent hydrolase (beta-lactamase superfamily II)